jgi:ribosomal protein S14
MKSKHCNWCDTQFQTKLSYQIYCSPECREQATREKIAEKYNRERIKKRGSKIRLCKSCGTSLSIYNEFTICNTCESNPDELSQILKEIKGIANGKIELE